VSFAEYDIVLVSIIVGPGLTDLLLTQEGVAADEWQEVHAGWLNVPFPLKACVVHGVDLRNHDPSRAWEQGCADQ